MNVKQKEIILLPFPFTNQAETKVRPALIVSNDLFNKMSDDCICVPLTSVLKNINYSIFIDDGDLISGKLIKPSRIRADKLFAIEKEIVIMKIGELSSEKFNKVRENIFAVL